MTASGIRHLQGSCEAPSADGASSHGTHGDGSRPLKKSKEKGDIYQNDGIYGIIEASSEGMEEDASREQPADELLQCAIR